MSKPLAIAPITQDRDPRWSVKWRTRFKGYLASCEAIVVDPRHDDSSCRVLLLEWLGGQLKTLDVLGLARAALETARIVSTKA